MRTLRFFREVRDLFTGRRFRRDLARHRRAADALDAAVKEMLAR